MANVKSGDLVRVRTREATPQDIKNGRYYPHYRGLTGHVLKVYGPDEVSVEVQPETLPEDVWLRHMQTRDQMRQQWLDGLPDATRRKLTPEQKDFELRYVILIAMSDLEKRRGPRPRLV